MTLPTKIHMVKAMLFPEVMNRYKSWTIKEAEHQRIDAFKVQCWISTELSKPPPPGKAEQHRDEQKGFLGKPVRQAGH